MGIKKDGGLGYSVDINGPRQGSSALIRTYEEGNERRVWKIK